MRRLGEQMVPFSLG